MPKGFEIGSVFSSQRSNEASGDFCELIIINSWGYYKIKIETDMACLDISLDDLEDPS